MKDSLKFTIDNFAELEKELHSVKHKGEVVIQRTVSDVKKRAPGWISTQIVDEYGIKKADVVKNQKHPKAAAAVRVKGETVSGIEILYKGPLLVPSTKRFNMSPISRPANGAPYFIKATIKGGNRKILRGKGDAIFIAPSRGEGTTVIPFQRMPDRTVKPFKTLSIPQMVTNDKVEENIYSTLNANIEKRLQHHMKQVFK